MPIPYRIQTPRLVIRCYQPADAPLLHQAISESLMHLRAWMPWAMAEPQTLEQRVARLRLMRGQYDLDQDYTLGIFNPEENLLLGSTGLHKRQGKNALEIGYWVHVAHTGKGYAREAAQALTQAGFDYFGAERLEIHCDPTNLASRAIPQRLGYTHEATLKNRTRSPLGEKRDTMIWTLFREDFLQSACDQLAIQAFDACGQELPTRAL